MFFTTKLLGMMIGGIRRYLVVGPPGEVVGDLEQEDAVKHFSKKNFVG